MTEGQRAAAPVLPATPEPSPARSVVAWVVAGFAILLILVPFLLHALSVPAQLEAAVAGRAPAPMTDAEFQLNLVATVIVDIAMPGLGLLLLSGVIPFIPAPAGISRGIRSLFRAWVPQPPGRGVAEGITLTPTLFVYAFTAAAVVMVLTYQVQGGAPEEVVSPFSNASLVTVIGIALVAGIGEELLYRGILQGLLQRVVGLWPAVIAQALFFGVLHAGYGNWVNPTVAAGFGLIAGVLAGRIGLVPLMVAHAAYDVVVISLTAPGLMSLAGFLFLAILTFSVVYSITTRAAMWRRVLGMPAPQAAHQEPPLAPMHAGLDPVPVDGPVARPPALTRDPVVAGALERAGHRVCGVCGRYPLQAGGLTGGTWRCQVCHYEALAAQGGPSAPYYAARLAEVRKANDAVVEAALHQRADPQEP